MLLNVGLAKSKPEKTSKYLGNISKAIEQANALATKFQSFTLGGEIRRTTVSINRIIEDSVSVALSGSDIICSTDCKKNDYLVNADSKQLNEVFTNLLINAKQAMNSSGRIFIDCMAINLEQKNEPNLEPGRYIRIRFRDEGIGIPPENLSKIFDPFFTTKSDGYGLGLSSAYYIIQNHNGSITVHSELFNGTVFTVYLPESQKPVDEEPEPEVGFIQGNGEYILVMDDDEDIRSSLVEIFSMLNYNAVFTANGTEAVKEYNKLSDNDNYFSAAILDLTIKGGESGEKVLEQLMEIDPEIKAIVFSGHSTTPVLANFGEYGFKAILKKPVTINEISHVLNEVLKSDF
jgi:CheY-like chemotaxis protein